jgi:glycosyltransferase involved in cell wall biosynthesis
MKVLIYGEYFFPVIGGVQTFMDLLARGFSESHRQEILNGSGPVEVVVVTNTARGEMDDSKLSYPVVRKPSLRKLVRLIRESDLVHIEGPCFLPMLISRIIGKPYLVEHHVYQAICPNGLLFKQPSRAACIGHFSKREYRECLRCCAATMGRGGAFRALLLSFPRRWLCKSASANISVTNHVSRRLHMPRTQTIYCGIDDVPARDAPSGGNDPGVIEFGYVGRLVAEKGLPLLIEAANHLARNGGCFRLSFVGDGPERAHLETLVDQYDLREHVLFTGDMRGADFARVASQIVAIVMPSIWEETAGLAAIEQMMRGGVVIAADIGGLGEIVGDAGVKFQAGDWRSLASAMQRVIDEPSLAGSLGSVARARANALFRRDAMIESQLSLCREIIAR